MTAPKDISRLIERFARKKDGDWLKRRAKPGDVPVPEQSDEASETPTGPWHSAIWYHAGDASAAASFEAVESSDCSSVLPRGIIESWGRGTLKIRELLAAAELPMPEFESGHGEVTVRFRAAVAAQLARSPTEQVTEQVSAQVTEQVSAQVEEMTRVMRVVLRSQIVISRWVPR